MKNSFFKLAKRIALKSPSRFKIGCIIANKNIVLSTGYNDMRKTLPGLKTWGSYRHAELDALIGLSYEETKGSVAYIYRETLTGELANSRPCVVCYDALKQAGIKIIYYTTNDGYKKEKL